MSEMFKNLENKLNQLGGKKITLFVGWDDPQLAMIARVQEYGEKIDITPKMRKFFAWAFGIHLKRSTTQIVIPPRPHRANTIKKNQAKWKKTLAIELRRSGYNLEASLEALGMQVLQDYKAVLMSGKFKQISGATRCIRTVTGVGGSAPLYATGELQRRLKAEVTND